MYAALLGEIKDDLLDLNEAIYMGKEEFNLIESETEDEDTNDEDV